MFIFSTGKKFSVYLGTALRKRHKLPYSRFIYLMRMLDGLAVPDVKDTKQFSSQFKTL
jgi:hypothetical protein